MGGGRGIANCRSIRRTIFIARHAMYVFACALDVAARELVGSTMPPPNYQGKYDWYVL